ncbi:MAG: 1-acyl-sn-glycerol-3-phosphate acyltransferase [Bacteroidales bacterium]|nr:1-acyl-sn-glycerol-3-phosphate acyltransferase [Bacteroidales bacterium]
MGLLISIPPEKFYLCGDLIDSETMLRKILILLYQPYKWLIYLPLIAVGTVFFGSLAFTMSILFNERIGGYMGGVLWAKFCGFLVPMLVKVKGREHIKKGTSYVIMANHQSSYDIILLYGWIGVDFKWIMKKELRKIPGLGYGSEKVGHIFIDRSNSRAALESLNLAKKKLVNGTCVIVFPEGTRSETGEPGVFKRGGFKMALDLELPILPVSLAGTRNILAVGSWNILPGRVKMIIHEPVDISSYTEKNIRELMDRTKEIIYKPMREN